ncbi:ALP1-like protein isoform X1 [Tanacetum coccineum]
MQISERSSRLALDHFCQVVMEIYGPGFLRKPTVTDVEKLLSHSREKPGFPGMSREFLIVRIGSGSVVRTPLKASTLDVIMVRILSFCLNRFAYKNLWIWHAFFGVAGSNNDVNVLYQSPIFNDLKTGRAPEIPFVANDVTYPSGYYLIDEIYPELVPLVKTIPEPADDDHKQILYKQKQESARKYVERRVLVFLRRMGNTSQSIELKKRLGL